MAGKEKRKRSWYDEYGERKKEGASLLAVSYHRTVCN